MFPKFSEARTPTVNTNFKANQVGFYVGTTGTLTVKFRSGETASFAGVPAGTFVPVKCQQVTVMPANTLVLYE